MIKAFRDVLVFKLQTKKVNIKNLTEIQKKKMKNQSVNQKLMNVYFKKNLKIKV